MKKIVLALSLMTAMSANAAVYDLELGGSMQVNVNYENFNFYEQGADFEDFFNFSLNNTAEVTLDFIADDQVFNFPSPTSFGNGSDTHYYYRVDDVSYAFYDLDGNKLLDQGGVLEPGDYSIKVSGVSSGLFGGRYYLNTQANYVTAASPVPENSTLSMIGLGLLTIGGVAFKRTKEKKD